MIQIGLTDYTPDNKIINIKDKNGVIKAKYAIGAKDVLKYTLMSEHYIEISFELNRSTSFKRSDYIEWEGDKYTLRSDYKPEQINKRKYQYTLKFEAVEIFFQDIQYYYLNQGLKESEWRLTGNPGYFIQIAVDNINRYFGTTSFMVGTIEPTEIKDILFDKDTNTFDALTQIADEYGAEWYITGKTIHFLNKVSFGSEVAFETEISVLSMKREEGSENEKYTRIVALGSTRNIPNDYRAPSSGEAVDAIYSKRLRIPVSKGDVINAYPNMLPDEVVEGTVIFDEVYPKRIGTIEAIGTIEYTDTDQDTGEQTKWDAYKFKDSGINFKEEYVLPGQELKLSFQSGDLNGRDFALIFHEKGFSDTDNSQYFEIVRTDEHGNELPNDIMKPKPGDKYVLYGFNIALVSDQYVPEAEMELYDTAVEWLQKQLQDTGVYECASVIKYFMDNVMDLAIGQKVRLVHEQFDTGYRSSRIMGFEKKLNNKYDAIYTVGDNSTYSRFGKIEKDIKELQHAGIVYENTGGGSSVYVIKQFDTTRPTDFNVYSAAASDAKYFNKQTGGTVSGDTIFQKNMQVQGVAVSNVFQNSTFTAGQLGSGFQIKKDANGQSYMEIDNILVRREAVFNRLTIAEIKSIGGTILLSLASMVISKVEDKTYAWKCYFNNEDETIHNDFAVGDQAICRKFTGKDIKYYWALVTAVGADYIELSKADKDGSGSPGVDDEVVQLGSRTDVNRQSAIMLSSYGYDSPSIKQYSGINSYDLTEKEVTVISPKGNKFTGSFTISTNGTTSPVYKDRNIFENGTIYYLNDRVSYLGSYWVCIVDSTIQTPNKTSTVWRKDTVGKTDIDNSISNIHVGGRNILINSKIHLEGTTYKVGQWDSSRNFIEGEELTVTIWGQIPGSKLFGMWFNIGYILGMPIVKVADGIYSATLKVPAGVTMKTIGIYLVGNTSNTDSWVFECIKLETGNKSTDWTPAPEDVQSGIDKAASDAENAQADADMANSMLADIASDNKFTPVEKQETKKEWDSILSEYPKNIVQAGKFGVSPAAYTAAYNVLSGYITPLLANLETTSNITGTTFRANFRAYYEARTDLLNAVALEAQTAANNAQQTADNAMTEAGKVRTEYKTDFKVLDDKISSKVSQSDFNALNTRVGSAESTILQIPDQIKASVETSREFTQEFASSLGKGKMIFRDPTFINGLNDIVVYNNLSNGNVILERISGLQGNPNGSGYAIKIQTIGAASPGFGGFALRAMSAANKRFVFRFIANIPADKEVIFASNATGDNYVREWLTNNKGTGKWEEYIYIVKCGDTGTFLNTGYFYLQGGSVSSADNPLIWYVSYATVFDITDTEIDYIADAEGKYTAKTVFNSTIEALEGKIELKTSKIDFDALGNRVSSAESSIDAIPGKISISVSESKQYTDDKAAEITKNNSFNAGNFVYNENASSLSSIIGFNTNIPLTANMWILDISGYAYGSQTVMKAQIAFYYYTTNAAIIATGYTNEGGIPISKVRLGIKNSKIAVEITTQPIYYLNLDIKVIATRLKSSADVANGWVQHYGFDSTHTGIVEIERKQTLQDAAAEGARTIAVNAQQAADYAQTSADEANSLLSDIASDNKLTPVEKKETKKEWDAILSEYTKNVVQAGQFEVSVNAYTSVYSTLFDYITPLLSNIETTSNITGATFRANFKSYYDGRTDLLNAIATKAKQLADNAQNAADVAKTAANNAQGSAENAQADADMANSMLADIASDNKFTPVEKQETKKEWDSILSEYPKNIVQAGKFGVSPAAYTAAYNVLSGYITPLLANLETTSNITGTTFRANFRAYYEARTDLLNAVALAAQTAANNAQQTADGKTTMEEVSSSFTITANKISLGSQTIELKGNTIAQAIEAEDLKVGDRAGASALEVLTDGTLYAMGSSSGSNKLEIDSKLKKIQITSSYSASGNGNNDNVTSITTLSSDSGGLDVRDSNNHISLVSPNGVFSNYAGQSVYPSTAGFQAKTSVLGIGFGSMSAGSTGNEFIAGVTGWASNSVDESRAAPTFGGYFQILKAAGLVLQVKNISGDYTLSKGDVIINSYADSTITVTTPMYPYVGQTYIIRRVNSSGIILRGNRFQIWRAGAFDSTTVDSAQGDSTMLIFDGNYWQYYKMTR